MASTPSIDNPGVLVSICIPTLNRGHLIGETLESIVSQACEQLEVVIVDGGSTDNTQDVVAEYQRRFPGLRYFKTVQESQSSTSDSPSNRGFDQDCDRAVQFARGAYCWLFTDDDIMKPGAIAEVLRAARQDFQLIVVNADVYTTDMSRVLELSRLKLASDRVFEANEYQDLFALVGAYLSFVGGVVVRRDLWLSRNKQPYLGSGFIHVGTVFQAPLPGKALVISRPGVSIRYGDAQYMRSARYFVIWMFTWPTLIWNFAHYSDVVKRQVCHKEPFRRIRSLLLHRAIGAYSHREYDGWLKPRLRGRAERLTARFIALFPGVLANFLGVAYYYLSGNPPGQFLLDLQKSPYYFARRSRRSEPAATANRKRVVAVSAKTPIKDARDEC